MLKARARERKELLAYEVGRLVHLPGTRPYIFYLVFKHEALRAVGLLEKVARVFAELDTPILQLKTSVPYAGESLRVIVITDLAGRESLASKLAEMLRKIPTVLKVEYEEPLMDGWVLDTKSFPLRLFNERAILMNRAVYEGLIRSGWERFGSGYGQLLYIVGFEIGRYVYGRYCSHLDRELMSKLALNLMQLMGYGIVDVVELDDSGFRAVVRVYDSFECELFRGVGEIRGNLVRGMLAGWLAERWGGLSFDQVTAREVKCIARGDPHCEYHITGREQGRSR